jgi:hypothetical protein
MALSLEFPFGVNSSGSPAYPFSPLFVPMRVHLARRSVARRQIRGKDSPMPSESHPFSDEIHIEQLEVSARIGVPEEERATAQRLTVSISFWPHHRTRDLGDNI